MRVVVESREPSVEGPTEADRRLMRAVNAAELAGYVHFAGALVECGRREHPKFWTVTGRDFGRSIAWARRTRSSVSGQIDQARAKVEGRRKREELFNTEGAESAEKLLREQMQGILI